MTFRQIQPAWRIADDFSITEAAALMAGYEPSTVRSEGFKFWFESENGQTASEGATEVQANLRALINAVNGGRIKSANDGNTITRSDLVAWLANKSYRPAFFFSNTTDSANQQFHSETAGRMEDSQRKLEDLEQEVERPNALLQETRVKTNRATHWPWGDHRTKALGHLEAAAKHWWVRYDPTDQTTAPKNDEVSEWLKKERGASKNIGDAIASILRLDGLPTGPRR